MRIYVAASIAASAEACRFAVKLFQDGHQVTSSWLTSDNEESPKRERFDRYPTAAARDLNDLMTAEALILLDAETSTSGGMWTELGYWLGLMKSGSKKYGSACVVSDDSRNVFAYADGVMIVEDQSDALDWARAVGQIGHAIPKKEVEKCEKVLSPTTNEAHRSLTDDLPF